MNAETLSSLVGDATKSSPVSDASAPALSAEVQRLRAERDALKAALADLVTSLSEQYNADGLTGFAVIRDYHAAVAALHAARAALNQ